MAVTLYIGNKNYSSWSLRAWLALRWGGICFQERVIRLGVEGYGKSQVAEVRAVSPSGRVPALDWEGTTIYDSLAICEWAAETTPELWPADRHTRALARAAAAEMHSGFDGVRRDLSMNIRRQLASTPDWPDDTLADLARIEELWTQARARHRSDGPWLFGSRSIADAMYAPVVTRLQTYAVPQSSSVAAYCETVLSDPDMAAWVRDAHAERWAIESADGLYADAPKVAS